MRKAILHTVIDGVNYSFTGKISPDGNTLLLPKGMVCSIGKNDTVEYIEQLKRDNKDSPVLLDMASWFKMTKQI